MENFGLIGNEFINLYSEENPILEKNDNCYFMFTNNNDYHRPLIARGIIVQDKFTDGMNKTYHIRLLDILESPKTISDFIFNKPFTVYPYSNNFLSTKRLVQLGETFDFSTNLFKITAFFVRTTEQKIIDLRKEYITVIRQDVLKQLKDIESI